MLLLFDIGNTNTHLGLANDARVLKQASVPTRGWFDGSAGRRVEHFTRNNKISGVALCSVVPRATPRVRRLVKQRWRLKALELTPARLENAMAVSHHFGVPAVVVDFGTAVTFDVVDGQGRYIGGIIAPGLSAMTDYLHEKTALLPRIQIREIDAIIGKSTEEAMMIGAVKGYRGLIRGLLRELKRELHCRRLPVAATGSYARLIADKMPEITVVEPLLTLEGLRLLWQANHTVEAGRIKSEA